jgi:hypothetical protein
MEMKALKTVVCFVHSKWRVPHPRHRAERTPANTMQARLGAVGERVWNLGAWRTSVRFPPRLVVVDVQWLSQKLEIKDRTVGKDKQISTNLAGAVYDRLYMARNHFLHGNPVTAQTLMLEKCRKHVHLFAPSLFRLALTAFLDLRFSETLPDTANNKIEGDISRNR